VRPKEFVDGEGFAYLGRSYRLKLVPPGASTSAVKLVGGRFVMPTTFAPEGRTHLIRWYSDRARPWLAHKVKAHAARMEVDPTGVRVQGLGYRWGSCGKGLARKPWTGRGGAVARIHCSALILYLCTAVETLIPS